MSTSRQASPRQLETLDRHLWFAVDPAIRFVLRTPCASSGEGMTTLERYWLLPTSGQPRILVPAASSAATAGSLLNFRALRTPRTRVARTTLGMLARSGAPIGRRLLHVECPTSNTAAPHSLPTRAIAGALGRDEVYAAVGIRDGENGKATLQLVDRDGAPVGYAKLGWDAMTDEYVRTEAATLSSLTTEAHIVRAPAVMANLEYAGHPIVVTEPLPLDVRAVRARVPPPTAREYLSLCPLVRHAPVATTRHVRSLRARLDQLSGPLVAGPAGHARQLLDLATLTDVDVPVAARWHGDFAPWNCARDKRGVLWVWDWESSETDAVAGLDALHWSFSQRRLQVSDLSDICIDRCITDSQEHLAALAITRNMWRAVAQVYVVAVIERACAIAAVQGSWQRSWIRADQLEALARQLIERPVE